MLLIKYNDHYSDQLGWHRAAGQLKINQYSAVKVGFLQVCWHTRQDKPHLALLTQTSSMLSPLLGLWHRWDFDNLHRLGNWVWRNWHLNPGKASVAAPALTDRRTTGGNKDSGDAHASKKNCDFSFQLKFMFDISHFRVEQQRSDGYAGNGNGCGSA